MLHISDIHFDFHYTPGTIKKCNLPVCCNPQNGYTTDPELAAGQFGEYACDLPEPVFLDMMHFIKENIKPEAIIWPGDNSVHSVWDNTEKQISKYTDEITERLKEFYPKESGVNVYPTIGNHDTWPVNNEDFSKADNSKPLIMYDEIWSDYFTTPEAKQSFKDFGYYSMPFKANGKVYEKTWVIAINC